MNKKPFFGVVIALLLLSGCGKKSNLSADHGGAEETCASCVSVKKNEVKSTAPDNVTALGITSKNNGTYFPKYVSELSKKPLSPYEKIDAYKTTDPKAPSIFDQQENKTLLKDMFDTRTPGPGHFQKSNSDMASTTPGNQTLSDYYTIKTLCKK